MASVEKLRLYVSRNESIHKKSKGEQIIGVQVLMVKTAIDNILAIIASPS